MTESQHPKSPAMTAALPETGLFIELGQCRRKDVARLKEGTGNLTRRVKAAICRWREELGIDLAADVIPVVLLYRRVESPTADSWHEC